MKESSSGILALLAGSGGFPASSTLVIPHLRPPRSSRLGAGSIKPAFHGQDLDLFLHGVVRADLE